MKITLRNIAVAALGGMLILAGIAHFAAPEFYFPMIPDIFPKEASNFAAGIVELVLGIGVLLPPTRKLAALGIVLLMIAFFPLHVWDLLQDEPVIGSKGIAVGRLFVQVFLIAWPWWIWKGERAKA